MGGKKQCQLCHYSNHLTAKCNIKDQPKIQKERRAWGTEQNRKRNKATKEKKGKKEKETAHKAKDTKQRNVQPNKDTTMAIIKQLTEAGWKAPNQPSKTLQEKAKSFIDLNMFNHLADNDEEE